VKEKTVINDCHGNNQNWYPLVANLAVWRLCVREIIDIVDIKPWITFVEVIMAALCNRAGHYIFALWFLLLFFFFSPRLISAVTDWMSVILPHMVWP